MTVLIQDGRAGGHFKWLDEVLTAGLADGAIISPFRTPRATQKRNPSGSELAELVQGHNGEVLFDATTHALTLPSVTPGNHYGSWSLWGGTVGDLSTAASTADHVERVFDVQSGLGTPLLVPTVSLESPLVTPALRSARALARAGKDAAAARKQPAWQSIAGTHSFWEAGADLDAYVGELVQLRAPVWVVTFIRDRDSMPPDTSNPTAQAGFLRTIHSLSERARVITAHSDLFGLPAVAAGSDTIGTGWHGAQRVFAADSYRPRSGGTNIRWTTYPVLMGRLSPDTSASLARADPALANRLRGGHPLPVDDEASRRVHLQTVRDHLNSIAQFGSRADRVQQARRMYDAAQLGWALAAHAVPGTITPSDAAQWAGNPRAGLELYARAEGL